MDATDVVRAQHLRLGALLLRCTELAPVTEHARGPEMRERQQVLRALRRHFAQAASANERHLYPALKGALPDGRGVVRRLLSGKQDAERLLLKMRWYGDRDPRLTDLTGDLVEAVRRHLDEESRGVERLRAAVHPDVLAELGRRMQRMERLAPTRPHPDMPTSPLAAALTWPVVSVLDRLRDGVDPAPTGI